MQNTLNNMNSRNFEKAVADAAQAMSLSNKLFYYCYFGGKAQFTYEYFMNLWVKLNILDNLYFNAGYIWTDIILLSLATPSTTEEDYMYFVSFYLGDLIFRFIFRQT